MGGGGIYGRPKSPAFPTRARIERFRGKGELLGHLQPLNVQSWERCAGVPRSAGQTPEALFILLSCSRIRSMIIWLDFYMVTSYNAYIVTVL